MSPPIPKRDPPRPPSKMILYGFNGYKVAIDLYKIEAIVQLEGGELQVVTGTDCYKVVHDFNELFEAWRIA